MSAGAGQTMEDVMVLQHLFRRVGSPHDLSKAFKAYDEVCRPRSQQVIDRSLEVGIALSGRDPEKGLDPVKLADIPAIFDYVREFDLENHRQQALDAFESEAIRKVQSSIIFPEHL